MNRATRAIPAAHPRPGCRRQITAQAPAPEQTDGPGGNLGSALKIAVVGGFGSGKTTMVRSVSEIRTLHTEEAISGGCLALGDTPRVRDKAATTVGLDFGRITIRGHSVLYLFGAPGHERFRFLCDRLLDGTPGAVVLVDTRSLTDSWYAVDRLKRHGTPFIVAVNDFGGPFHSQDHIREVLAVPDDVPLMEFDARDHSSSRFVLIALVEHLRAQKSRRP
ncbi:ATP/GTP-binding protein [Streptomyces sp. NPDC002187]|uniref:GTP-binding protein n=1 Tax=Streptomyces sp. NPDC002187 TaxID=3364637 RepID=UPI00369BDF97